MKKKDEEDKIDKNIARELYSYSFDEIENMLVPSALRKMQEYLVTNNYASKFGNIKRKPRIEIKGVSDNGAERLLGKEIRERFDLDWLEASRKFNTFYPIWSEGVIKYESKKGKHYSHFKVLKQDEKNFDMEIKEYKFFHNTFYLSYIVEIKGISKHEPFYYSKVSGSDVRKIFYDLCKESNEFSELEKRLIVSTLHIEQNAEEELDIIMCNTLANIRVVNYLWELFQNNDNSKILGSFYDNEFWTIKNWKYDINVTHDLDKIYSKKMEEYISQLLSPSEEPKILKNNTIEKIINNILMRKDVSVFNVAVGFAFQSGLDKISDVFELTKKGRCRTNLIIGSLQNYANKYMDKKIDRETVRYLENIRKNCGVKIYTYTNSFYHGKFYYIKDSRYTYIIVGSSNISKTAFFNNYELDCLYVVANNSNKDKMFFEWFDTLKKECSEIEKLDEKEIESFQWEREMDIFQYEKNQGVSSVEIEKRLANLSDEETKFRLNLWLKHKPVAVYDNVNNAALKEYSMFVFSQPEMIVFESFIPRNAFYIFGCPNGVEALVESISNMTKRQMAMSIHYVDRGRHVANKERLKNRIDNLFK